MGSNDKKSKKLNKIIIENRDIGQRIREEREKLGLSRAEFAEIIELSDYYVGQLERGERQMSLSVMLKIAACLHLSLDYLIFGTSSYRVFSVPDNVIPAYTNETNNNRRIEIYELLEKCSERELDLFKKLLQTILPYIR